MFPSPDAVSIQYRKGADDLRIVLKRRFCDTPRSRGEGTQVLPPLEALIKLSLITAHQTKWRCRLVFARLLPGPESSSGTFYSLRPP